MRFNRFVPFVACVALAACAGPDPAGPSGAGPSGSPSAWLLHEGAPSGGAPDPRQLLPGEAAGPSLVASGTFRPYRPGSTAVTYDPAVVPPGARARVAITRTTT